MSLRWIEQSPMQYGFQFWIVNQLAALPIKKVFDAYLFHGGSRLNPLGARVLE